MGSRPSNAAARRLSWGELARRLAKDHPPSDAASWDNPGLQAGDPARTARRVLVALDLTSGVIDQAVDLRADGIVAHHPLIFSPLKSVRADRYPESAVGRLLRHGLCFLAMHTNLDVASDGPSFWIARGLGIPAPRFLKVTRSEARYKIVTWLPEASLERALDALAAAGAGVFGEYTRCAFSVEGTGEFTASAKSSPAAGRAGARNREPERRLETTCPERHLSSALAALRAAHPYETPVIEAFRIEGGEPARGYGALGDLPAPATLPGLIGRLLDLLGDPSGAGTLPCVPGKKNDIQRIAAVSGSGMSFLDEARAAGADLLITGDVKHHDAVRAAECGLAVIDAGHFATEAPCRARLAELVREAGGGTIETIVATESDPLPRIGRTRTAGGGRRAGTARAEKGKGRP